MGGRHSDKQKPRKARPAPATPAPVPVRITPLDPPPGPWEGTHPRRQSFPGARPVEERSARRLVSAETAAVLLDVHPGTIRNWVAKGRIEYVKVGNRTKFYLSTIHKMIDANTFPVVED
jgi:excisionase family DNA binding protein